LQMKKPIEHARDEIMQTIIDLMATIPGLQASVLLSMPAAVDEIEATFFATHDTANALKIMQDMIRVGTMEKVEMPSPPIPPGTPEAS
jgi:hypothetical protein